MKPGYEKLPFRPNVCMIIFKGDNFLIACRVNWPDGFWKFPQGGIEEGEDPIEAGKRECAEEIGTDKIKILGVSKHKNKYDWDDDTIERHDCRYRGQFQRFLLIEFLGDDEDIKLDPEELREYKWATREEIIDFNKQADHTLFWQYHGQIEKVLEEFGM